MNNKRSYLLGMSVLGICLIISVCKYRSYERTVEVKGLCESEVAADRVIWPITYKIVADDIEQLYYQIERDNDKILSFLTAGGIEKEYITIAPPKLSDKYAEEYGDNDRTYRFIATNVVTVCTDRVEEVIKLMARQSELIKMGILIGGNNWENQIEFTYEGLNSIKPQMIEEATRNAREAAEKFAKDSGSKLGKIKRANQGIISIENRDGNTPYIKKVRVVTTITYYLRS